MIVHNEWEALSVAIEMERRAIRIYERALLLAGNDAVREGIDAILQQEKRHLARFGEMQAEYPPAEQQEKALLQAMGAETLFPGGVMEMERANGLTLRNELYNYAARSEQQAVETYLSFADKCHDRRVAEVFRSIAAEESVHLVHLQEQKGL